MDLEGRPLLLAASALVVSGVYAVSAQQPKSQWDGVYTEAQAARGNDFFNARRVSCHLGNLTGLSAIRYRTTK